MKVNSITICSSKVPSQPCRLSRFQEVQKNILENLSLFQPKKNALPVALTHLLLDNCQGLLHSLPLLLEVCTVYAKKGDESHYFEPDKLNEQFGLIEHVSSGKQFQASELSKAFEIELNQLDKLGVISKGAMNWSLILIFKIGKKTHSFSIKKLNKTEYVLHSLYEIDQEQIQNNEKEYQQEIKKREVQMSFNQSTKRDSKKNATDNEIKSIQIDTQSQYLTQHNSSQLLDESHQSTLPTTFNKYQSKHSFNLQDNMSFQNYNCSEIRFSPFAMLLGYLNYISDDLLLPLKSASEPNPHGFMQLIAFTSK